MQHPIPTLPPGSPFGPDGIRPTEMPGIYLVPSRSRFFSDGLMHTVDGINERCDCEDFTFRRSKLEPGTALHPNLARRCEHLRLVLETPVIALPAPLGRATACVSAAGAIDAEPAAIVPAFPCRGCGAPASPLYRLDLCGICGMQQEVFG